MYQSRNHWTVYPQESVFCIHQGKENHGKEVLVVIIVTACIHWLLYGDMLPVCGTYSMGDIPSGSELLLHPFPFIWVIRAMQIFILEFSKGGSADLGDEFADGGAANQPVVLQGGVGLSSPRCLRVMASLSPTSSCFLK